MSSPPEASRVQVEGVPPRLFLLSLQLRLPPSRQTTHGIVCSSDSKSRRSIARVCLVRYIHTLRYPGTKTGCLGHTLGMYPDTRRGYTQYLPAYPPREYIPEYPPREYIPGYPPREYIPGYPPREYIPGYPPREYILGYPPPEYIPGYLPQSIYPGTYPRVYTPVPTPRVYTRVPTPRVYTRVPTPRVYPGYPPLEYSPGYPPQTIYPGTPEDSPYKTHPLDYFATSNCPPLITYSSTSQKHENICMYTCR